MGGEGDVWCKILPHTPHFDLLEFQYSLSII